MTIHSWVPTVHRLKSFSSPSSNAHTVVRLAIRWNSCWLPTQAVLKIYRDFPLGFHDRAIPAAVAANCAGEQDKYWEMHGVLMKNQTKLSDADLAGFAQGVGVDMDKWTACLSNPAQEAEVRKDMEDASAVGVTGTPAFFINGVLLSGAVPFDQFKSIIDKELAAL